MERLINVNDVSLNFNLRQPQGNKSTNVYCVLKCGRVQYKYAIGCKCNSYQWNKRQQLPIVNANMTADDMTNNIKVANIINQIKFGYMNFYSYLCSAISMTENEIKESITNIIKESISNDMANENNLQKGKGKSPKATTLLQKAFNIYFSEVHPNTKDSSKKIEKGKLNSFISYCEEIGKDGISMLTQKGLNDYKSYLIKKGESNKVVNSKCSAIAKYINDVLISHSEFNKYQNKLQRLNYTRLQEVKQEGEEKKRRPLTDEEINKLMDVELTEEEKEYRDLFILECNGSYRVSDTHKLFDKSLHRIFKKGDYEIIYINTKKESIDACIFVNNIVRGVLEKYKDGFKYADVNSKTYADKYNKMLKAIAKKAELNTIETWKDAKGMTHEQPLHEIIASHFARYTFIYNALFKMKLTPSETANFTGHKDDTMIKEVYNIYKKETKVNDAFAALERVGMVENEKKEESNVNTAQLFDKGKEEKEKELIEEYKKVLVYLGANYMDIVDINDIDKLFIMTYIDYQSKFDAIGIDVHKLKKIYNIPNITLKEKREILENLIEEVMTKAAN